MSRLTRNEISCAGMKIRDEEYLRLQQLAEREESRSRDVLATPTDYDREWRAHRGAAYRTLAALVRGVDFE